KPSYEMDETNPDWVPTLNLGHCEVKATTSDRHSRNLKRRYSRAVEDRAAKTMVEVGEQVTETASETPEVNNENTVAEAIEEEQDGEVEEETPGQELSKAADSEEEQEPAAKRQQIECHLCEQRREEINRLLQENRELRSELNKKQLDKDFFKNDTKKVKYYTGLPCFVILLSLFNTVRPFLSVSKKLSPFQMVLLTLMRLRLDLPVQHLCHIFNVSHKTLSNAFTDTLDVLYARLKPMVNWPERHCLQATMPPQFLETFGKHVAIIVDCFELGTERPSNLKARAQSFSRYKGRHTMKYLIGITPHGSISFISQGWGGCTSDKHITENCGLLSNLLPGDIVLADRGFDIKDSVGMMCAEIKMPSFTKGRCQLDAKDVEDTRALAHLRIHVERVIGCMRNKYKMLHRTIPIRLLLTCEGEEVTCLDKIVYVCCSLVNMCSSVV
uniref:Zgc:113019 n=2 Tax=Kryptolebias marmoratus TaxID=37003 RepID=A0A3Q2ZP36_KRYMA